MSRLTASRAAFDLIASFEGFRTRAVLAPDGQWTLGFGHTAAAREGLTVTRAQAEDLLRWDLLPIEDLVRQTAFTPLSQNQFDALVSFAYNIGIENFRTSDVLKCLNQGRPVAAALAMHAWRRAHVNGRVVTIDALVRRRAAESALFLQTIGARPAAPSSVLRPQADYDVPSNLVVLDPTAQGLSERELPQLKPANIMPDSKPLVGDPIWAPPESPELSPSQSETIVVMGGQADRETTTPVTVAPLSKVTTIGEATTQEVLTQATSQIASDPDPQNTSVPVTASVSAPEPVILPSISIPTLADGAETKASTPPMPRVPAGPMLPSGLTPFPGGADYTPANGSGSAYMPPANDGLKTRLHATPEVLKTPTQAATAAPVVPVAPGNPYDGFSLLVWGLLALGAALLAFGLYFSWQSGILTVNSPRREPTTNELVALFAAVSGFIILVTSGVAALTRNRTDT